MVLLLGVVAGLLGGFIRATLSKRKYLPYSLQVSWLVIVAMVAQWFAFSLPFTSSILPDFTIRLILVLSQFTLLAFVWENRDLPGFWILGAGLILNLTVIILNGGLMPITPETVEWLLVDEPGKIWAIGQRFGFGKDIVLPQTDTILWFLSDWFKSPAGWSYKVAFSPGDVVVAVGAFWLFWSMGGEQSETSLQEKSHVTTYLPPPQ